MLILSCVCLFLYLAILYKKTDSNLTKLILVLLAIFIAIFFPVAFKFFENVGSDSFIEIQSFEVSEAIFFISTLKSFFFFFEYKRFILTTLFFFLILYVVGKFKRVDLLFKYKGLPYFFLCAGLVIFSIHNFRTFNSNSNLFYEISRNFNEKVDIKKAEELRKLLVLVYIGESTSAGNMHLFGYDRNNTRYLDELNASDQLVQFNNVLSTHTHTTPSLIEAMSVSVGENKLDIFSKKKRVSLSELLAMLGIDNVLYSNQGASGSFNLATPIIFNKSVRNFSSDLLMVGNKDEKVEKPYDHIYFEKQLSNFYADYTGQPKVVFLHSYAGHGKYLKFIPKSFHQKVDDGLEKINPHIISPYANKETVDEINAYDSAISYIDYALHNTFKITEKYEYPSITIYFSDHGDSVFTNSGHDSSRANIFNFRVPFLMYFNKEAIKLYPEVYAKYKKLSKQESLDTLDKLPTLLLDIFNVSTNKVSSKLTFPNNFGVADRVYSKGFFARESNSGFKYISLDSERFNSNNYGDVNTGIFILNKQKKSNTLLCQHASNNIYSIVKGKLTTNCLELDLVVNNDHFDVYHPPNQNLHLHLENVINRNSNQMHFWIDAKNIDNPDNCTKLVSFMTINKSNYSTALIEFPSKTNMLSAEIRSCLIKFHNLGVETSYYLDTERGKDCIKGKDKEKLLAGCEFIKKQILTANEIGIGNISYDKKLTSLANKYDYDRLLGHNTWTYTPDELTDVILQNNRRVIYKNSLLQASD